MKHENAGHAGKNKTKGLAAGLIQGPAAPRAGQGSARGSVASSAPASRPVSSPDSDSVEFQQRGTEDIVFVFNDGQVRRFSADMQGRIESNYCFESMPRKIHSIHFGESCYFVRNGKIGARVQMTREEFFWHISEAFRREATL